MKIRNLFLALCSLFLSCLAMTSCDDDVDYIPTLIFYTNDFIIPAEGQSFDVHVMGNVHIQLTSNRDNYVMNETYFQKLDPNEVETESYVARIDSQKENIIHVTIRPNASGQEIVNQITVFSKDSKAQGFIRFKQEK